MTASTQIDPQVVDVSSLAPIYTQSVFLLPAVEGQGDSGGTGAVGAVYSIDRPSKADDLFGPASSLGTFVKNILNRGVAPVIATMSAKGTIPTLIQRQAAWALLESRRDVRIRLTDSVLQAEHVALATSCDNAALAQNKHVGIVAAPATTAKAAAITWAQAIQSKRVALIYPGVYDDAGILRTGAAAVAYVAAEVAKNSDIADDLDTFHIPGLTAIENDASGNPIINYRIAAGALVNDFEDLLQAGVSVFKNDPAGGVMIGHLRMTYSTDGTYDALMTRLIVDQLFVDIRSLVEVNNYMRKGNTQVNRDKLAALVSSALWQRQDWLQPKLQPDGDMGYAVQVTPSADNRQVTIAFSGTVVRSIQTVQVQGSLTIPV